MPRGDGTGPRGEGSRTGRGLGFCAGYGRPGFVNPGGRGYGSGYGYGFGGGGRGWGAGRGFGGGWRHYGYRWPEDLPEPPRSTLDTPEQSHELKNLRETVDQLKHSIDTILDRLSRIKPDDQK